MELLNGYILVRVNPEITETQSGFLLARNSVRLPSRGIVEAVAKEVDTVKVGDEVEFLRYASIEGMEPDTRICTLDMIIARV